MIKLVCFDLGGVLIRICRTWAEGCARAGLDVRGDVDRDLARSHWLDFNAEYQSGRIDLDAFSRRLSEAVDGRYTPDEMRRVHMAWTIDEYDGVAEVVAQLHASGLETAALSNTCHDHWEQLVQYPTFMALRRRFASHELGLRKPDPAIYRAVETGTGCEGGEIIFFDDLEENVAAAHALGWAAEFVAPDGAPATQIEHALTTHGVLKKS